MATIPPGVAELIVTKVHVSVSEIDPNFLGLMLERQIGQTRFLLTRPQVDVLVKNLLEAAKNMPKPL